ncbi:hypothetical protein LG3211_5138 [Lysobacter gummosus]|nr:hypothetical protein LG3211_5138 [Lysobacter gummosus]
MEPRMKQHRHEWALAGTESGNDTNAARGADRTAPETSS